MNLGLRVQANEMMAVVKQLLVRRSSKRVELSVVWPSHDECIRVRGVDRTGPQFGRDVRHAYYDVEFTDLNLMSRNSGEIVRELSARVDNAVSWIMNALDPAKYAFRIGTRARLREVTK